MLITYSEYSALGGKAPCDDFQRLELKARALIDYRTQGRVSLLEPVPSDIKLLAVEIIDKISSAASAASGDPAVTSVSNDGVSVAYASLESRSKALNDDITQLIDSVAGNLAYRGVD